MAKLTRVRGFAFGTVKVDNLKFDLQNNIYLIDVKRPAAPVRTRYDFVVPNRNGSQTFNDRYDDKYIDVVVGIHDNNIQARRTRQREFLSKIVGRKSRLVFLDEPNLYYEAEVIDGIDASEDEVFTEITIHFKCSYCMYEFLGDANDIIAADADFTTDELDLITNTQEWMNINTLTYKMIENTGNEEATPFLTITANTACTSIIIDNGINSFTLSNLAAGETVFIDSEKMIVYTKNGDEKVSTMTRFSGKFLKVQVGESMITISGASFNINLSFQYRNTYIV